MEQGEGQTTENNFEERKMSIAVFLKNNLTNIPPTMGRFVNRLPYDYRPGIGSVYRHRKKEISSYEIFSTEERQSFIFQQMQGIVDFAYQNIPAYKKYYDSEGFHPEDLKSFDDLLKIPLTSKQILNKYPLEDRSFPKKSRYLVNTGGSSGTPFGFYIEPSSMGHEWAHMHTIWKKLGYKPSDFKIGFAGRSTIRNYVDYDVVRNTFALDIYADHKAIAKRLRILLSKYNIMYLHGYPSSIYNFAIFCREQDHELQKILSDQLCGAFLSSEYPHAYYRDVIENVFNINTVSWYGHTERSVLAYEKNQKFTYEPFQTYGYTEMVKHNGISELVATSYYNQASPLIRYNTNDEIIEPIIKDGILESFKIKSGRSGEFVIDKDGKEINLTGLIFGRHHEIFNYSRFIQVKQIERGKIEIHYVAETIPPLKVTTLFDTRNVNIDISFVQRKEPIRTISGKINLLIRNQE